MGTHNPAEHLEVKKYYMQFIVLSLQNRGVFGNFTLIEEFACDLFPFDSDLMSMELESAFKVRSPVHMYDSYFSVCSV